MDIGKIDDIILDLKDKYINELEELIKLKTVSAENELDVFDEECMIEDVFDSLSQSRLINIKHIIYIKHMIYI